MTNTLEEAIELLRGLVEADHHHVFNTITPWRICGTTNQVSIPRQIKWIDTLTEKFLTRTIRVNGLTNKNIKSY